MVFDQGWVNYGVSVKYRDFAAEETAKVGGIAALVRSVASFSIHSPHTGMQVSIKYSIDNKHHVFLSEKTTANYSC